VKNIFLDYPDFIERDPRNNRGTRPHSGRYQPTAKFQYTRHKILLGKDVLEGQDVLDLGCCVGASGAWALHHGAKSYTGVEMEEGFCKIAQENLEKYFSSHNWVIKHQAIERFFEENTKSFDVVIAFGIIFSSADTQSIIKLICNITKKRLLLEENYPDHIVKLKNIEKKYPKLLPAFGLDIDLLSTQEMQDTITVYRPIKGTHLSLSFVKALVNHHGFDIEQDFTKTLAGLLPNEYVNRYSISLCKKEHLPKIINSLAHNFNDPSYVPSNDVWKFDSKIASNFVNYARHHIPGYDKVIKKTAQVCKLLLSPFSHRHRIIDVGCADGETIKQLYFIGFHNLVGVDSSEDMLVQARKNKINEIAELTQQSTFPKNLGPYNAVICNWTLHFIKNKIAYLRDIHESLLPGGILIITDKTYNDGASLTLYHDFKKTQGLSEEEIRRKHASLVDVMFIDPPKWYLETLSNLGFINVSIIDAEYCFTSFLAFKK
jgi:SAM-dependent methyltransferase